jgi:hypothetical protein
MFYLGTSANSDFAGLPNAHFGSASNLNSPNFKHALKNTSKARLNATLLYRPSPNVSRMTTSGYGLRTTSSAPTLIHKASGMRTKNSRGRMTFFKSDLILC